MTTRKLYTEADVHAMEKGGVLLLGVEAIATPAALDLAFAKGIRVRWSDGGVSPGSSHGSHDCLWHRILAGDGCYVVQVQDGRASVSRLTETGPVPFGHDTLEAHQP